MFNSWTPGRSGPLIELSNRFKRLEGLKAALDEARPLAPETAKSLRKALALEYTYNSNAIEGNSLTLIETKVVVEDGLTIGGRTMREHLEAINHNEAISFIEDASKGRAPLDERTLNDIHSLVLKGIDSNNAGRRRNQNVFISGARHIPPDALHVPEQMEQFFKWCASDEARRLSTVERAARMHVDLVNIHPFIDGNGRTARLIMNLELMKDGYPLAIIQTDQRLDYYANLDLAAASGDYGPFVKQICDIAEQGFEPYSIALGYELGRKPG
jgi:Fic family protein